MKQIKDWVTFSRSLNKFLQTFKIGLFLIFISTAMSFAADGNSLNEEELAQTKKTLTGVVTDAKNGEALPGVTVMVKATTFGTVTNINGQFSLDVPVDAETLVFSFIGYAAQELPIEGKTTFNVQLAEETIGVDEVVVVGYGIQKKESVVGAITQTSGEDLKDRAAGIVNVEEALQGNLPGVTTIQGSGIPGQSDMKIFVRGQSSWNGSGEPLILVDGIKRSMTDIDMNDIEKLSVLKDASATAVFGVEGANGVILITTKRGKTGKAELSLSANTTIKMVSKLPEKLDSYDAVMQSNSSILRELALEPVSWGDFTPMAIANKYRNPLTEEERYIYPNINWEDELFKDFAQDYRVNLSVRGGSKTAKYFGSLAYQKVDDIIDGGKYDSGKGYLGQYKYDRFNFRSNIDFNITKTTELSVNLSGYFGIRENPANLNVVVNGIYEIAPNAYTPVYPDGYYGQLVDDTFGATNPIVSLTNTGYNTYNTFQVNTDFVLKQKLDFITKGLSFKGRFSFDNNMQSVQSLRDPGGDGLENVVFRVYDGEDEIILSPNGVNDFDFVQFPWTVGASNVSNNSISRRMVYDLSLNYNRTFDNKHNVSALALVRRQEYARGSVFPTFREDWVGRVTYNYDSRYFIDVNGAYNGSEKFGPGFRFELFPSLAAGWTISNEEFMSGATWLDKLKFRGSYGLVGDDNFSGRWKYITQWKSGGSAWLVPSVFDGSGDKSPYTFYSEASVGNPNLQWETATKYNAGAEITLFDNLITAELDYFAENREDILIPGTSRSVVDWFGIAPPDYNGGAVEVRGYEIVLGTNYTFDNGLYLFGDFNFTQAKDKVIKRDDPLYTPFYQKQAGYPIGQPRGAIPTEIMGSWDDVYMSTPTITNQGERRVGYYDLVDFNGDGYYDSAFDNAPFGYPTRPQRNWSTTLGARYKGWSLSVQFYGTQNTLRKYGNRTFSNQTDLIYTQDIDYWTVETPDNTDTQDAWRAEGATNPMNNWYDASLTRLKTLSLSYNIPKKVCQRLGVKSLRVFANGNNLYLWTSMPDDREFNGNVTADSDFRGDYPTMKRFNFGFDLNF